MGLGKLAVVAFAALAASRVSVAQADAVPDWCRASQWQAKGGGREELQLPLTDVHCPRGEDLQPYPAVNCSNKTPINNRGRRLQAVLDSVDIQARWRAGDVVDWVTGTTIDSYESSNLFTQQRDGQTKPRIVSHGAAYVAAVARRLGIYLPHIQLKELIAGRQEQPSHSLLRFLNSVEAKHQGWIGLNAGADMFRAGVWAQHLANRGHFIVMALKTGNENVWRLAIVYPAEHCVNQVLTRGPQISLAGLPCNFNNVSTVFGFSCASSIIPQIFATQDNEQTKDAIDSDELSIRYYWFNTRHVIRKRFDGVWDMDGTSRVLILAEQGARGLLDTAMLVNSVRDGPTWVHSSSGISPQTLSSRISWEKHTQDPSRSILGRTWALKNLKWLFYLDLEDKNERQWVERGGSIVRVSNGDAHVLRMRNERPFKSTGIIRGWWWPINRNRKLAFGFFIDNVDQHSVQAFLLGYTASGQPTWTRYVGFWQPRAANATKVVAFGTLVKCESPAVASDCSAISPPRSVRLSWRVGSPNSARLASKDPDNLWSIEVSRYAPTADLLNVRTNLTNIYTFYPTPVPTTVSPPIIMPTEAPTTTPPALTAQSTPSSGPFALPNAWNAPTVSTSATPTQPTPSAGSVPSSAVSEPGTTQATTPSATSATPSGPSTPAAEPSSPTPTATAPAASTPSVTTQTFTSSPSLTVTISAPSFTDNAPSNPNTGARRYKGPFDHDVPHRGDDNDFERSLIHHLQGDRANTALPHTDQSFSVDGRNVGPFASAPDNQREHNDSAIDVIKHHLQNPERTGSEVPSSATPSSAAQEEEESFFLVRWWRSFWCFFGFGSNCSNPSLWCHLGLSSSQCGNETANATIAATAAPTTSAPTTTELPTTTPIPTTTTPVPTTTEAPTTAPEPTTTPAPTTILPSGPEDNSWFFQRWWRGLKCWLYSGFDGCGQQTTTTTVTQTSVNAAPSTETPTTYQPSTTAVTSAPSTASPTTLTVPADDDTWISNKLREARCWWHPGPGCPDQTNSIRGIRADAPSDSSPSRPAGRMPDIYNHDAANSKKESPLDMLYNDNSAAAASVRREQGKSAPDNDHRLAVVHFQRSRSP